jgi:hypothetical protein
MLRQVNADAELRVSYQRDDEWIGQLIAVVTSGAFSGAGAAWFDSQSIKDPFIARLRQFPIPEVDPPTLVGGFSSRETPQKLDQCHLGISVRPYGRRGALLAHVELATEARTTPDKDQQQSVIARFLTEYEAVGIFASHLEQVLDGEREFAVLSGAANSPLIGKIK